MALQHRAVAVRECVSHARLDHVFKLPGSQQPTREYECSSNPYRASQTGVQSQCSSLGESSYDNVFWPDTKHHLLLHHGVDHGGHALHLRDIAGVGVIHVEPVKAEFSLTTIGVLTFGSEHLFLRPLPASLWSPT